MASREPKRADSRRNRDQILTAAASVLTSEPDPTLPMIAAKAGVSRATIYRHFSDLDAIRGALLGEVADIARQIAEKHLLADDGAPFPQRFTSTIRAALPIRTRYSEAMTGRPEQDAGAIALFAPFAAALVKQAQQRSELRQDLDPQLMGEALVTMALYAARRVHRDGVPIDDAIHIIEVFVRGMESRSR